MAISSSSVTVTTSATLLFQADADGTEIVIYNNDHGGGHTTYVGGSDVTHLIGLPVAAGSSLSFRLRANEAVYGIAETGSHETRIMAL